MNSTYFFLSLSPHIQTTISRFWNLLCLTPLAYWKNKPALLMHGLLYSLFLPNSYEYRIEFEKLVLRGSQSREAWTQMIKILNSVLENKSGLIKGIWCPVRVRLGSLSPDLAAGTRYLLWLMRGCSPAWDQRMAQQRQSCGSASKRIWVFLDSHLVSLVRNQELGEISVNSYRDWSYTTNTVLKQC